MAAFISGNSFWCSDRYMRKTEPGVVGCCFIALGTDHYFPPGVIFKRQEIFLHHRFNGCKFFSPPLTVQRIFFNSPNFPLCRQFISAIFLMQTIFSQSRSPPPPPPWKIMARPSSETLYRCINLFDHTVNLAFLSSK